MKYIEMDPQLGDLLVSIKDAHNQNDHHEVLLIIQDALEREANHDACEIVEYAISLYKN